MPELTWQPTLLGSEPPSFDPTLHGARRRFLGAGAWVDVVPGWVTGGDALFDEVLERAPWARRASVDVRPLSSTSRASTPPAGTIARHWSPGCGRCLGRHYGRRLPSVTANLYRDGNDSVAWHGDRIGRRHADTVVAILSLGANRRFLLRPDGGGPSVSYDLASGDLLVMGGTCQKTWEHCVPKRAHAGPRISLMFREPGVR